MALFKRKNSAQDSLPREVKDYYDTSRRERVGVAWVLALLTLVVTVLLSLGLFFGGRWAYRAIFDDDSGVQTADTSSQDNADNTSDNQNTDKINQDVESTLNELLSDNTSEPGNQPGSGSSDTAASSGSNTAPADDRNSDNPTTPITGPLPDTGPGDNPL